MQAIVTRPTLRNRVSDFMRIHQPVMLAEALAGLNLCADGIYLDGTFGRGGHSDAILNAIGPSGFLHAMDQDPEACDHARKTYGAQKNLRIHHRNFSELRTLCSELNLTGRINGILLDLGVSSPQLDDAARGFSFNKEGPLDMRMNPQAGESAAQWLAHAQEEDIANVLFRYGEERNSRRIARRIVEARVETPFTTTLQLAALIAAVPGPRSRHIHPATRSFQAIRIFINRELDVLTSTLEQAIEVLAPGGRLVVISFHSLEDRIVKRYLRAQGQGDAPRIRVLKKLMPTIEESSQNPRSRSAVLRTAERLP